MVVVMQSEASEEQIQTVIDRLVSLGFDIHRSTGASHTVLGAVGMTGLATGPHLDYRMAKHGVFLNPLKVQSPPADPIAAEEEDAFQAARDHRLALLGPAPAGLAVAHSPAAPARATARTFSGASP